MQSKGTHLVKTTSFLETIVHGDIRCLTNEQIEATVSKMKAIVSSITYLKQMRQYTLI
jgi:glutamate carboxypeptidase